MNLDNIRQDLRYAFRALRRDRAFTIGAILILSVGIGANTAVFSVVESVLLRPLAYREPDRLVAVNEVIPQITQFGPYLPVNAWHFREWKNRCSCFEDVALASDEELNLTGTGEPDRIFAVRVTPNFFSVLGVSAAPGRTFIEEEGRAGKTNVVVLSDAFWRRRFGADPSVVGRTITLNGVGHLVLGILPADFRYHLQRTGPSPGDRVDLFRAWSLDDDKSGWAGDHNHAAVARLPKGKTISQALAELNVLQKEIQKRFEGGAKSFGLEGYLSPLQEQVVSGGRAGLLLFLAAVATVLLVACVNIGNLMLLRATARNRDTAIRAAIGAPRMRIFRGFLIESLIVALCGGILGTTLCAAFVRAFVAYAPAGLPRADEITMHWYVLGFSMFIATVCALVLGVVPAWRLMRTDPQDSLRAITRSMTESRKRLQLRDWLVSLEVALSTALLIVASLLSTSFLRLGAVQRGFETQNVVTAKLSLPAAQYPDKEKKASVLRRADRPA